LKINFADITLFNGEKAPQATILKRAMALI
jgi:hypothetical protein